MPAEEVVATLQQAWHVMSDLQIPAALMGGVALAHWGRIRTTQDVDLLIALSGVRWHTLLARFSAAGFRSKRGDPLVRLDDAEFIQLWYEPRGAMLDIQIDLLIADSPFHRQAVERRVKLPASELGIQVDVVSCEDLIVLKLMAWRILDRVDVSELLRLNRDTLDFGYLANWVPVQKVQSQLAEAWNDAFPGEQVPV